jgi:hypothetical protein
MKVSLKKARGAGTTEGGRSDQALGTQTNVAKQNRTALANFCSETAPPTMRVRERILDVVEILMTSALCV